jgi:hypothetical protein
MADSEFVSTLEPDREATTTGTPDIVQVQFAKISLVDHGLLFVFDGHALWILIHGVAAPLDC